MTPEQAALFAKARRALDAARDNLRLGHAETVLNRAYYAAFYAATAALREVGDAPKTHAGTHRQFFLHFVHAGRLAPDIGETLKDAHTLRQRTDYDAFAVTDEAVAADLLRDVEQFINAVEALLTTS